MKTKEPVEEDPRAGLCSVVEKGKQFAECEKKGSLSCGDCGSKICMTHSDFGGTEDKPKTVCLNSSTCKTKKTSVCKCAIF